MSRNVDGNWQHPTVMYAARSGIRNATVSAISCGGPTERVRSRRCGVVALMVTALEDTQSALHASCVTMRAASTRLLVRTQTEGMARTDIDGTTLCALAGPLAWLSDQPALAPRADRLFNVVAGAILTSAGSTDAPGERRPRARR
ncbi:SbtR family transcriptional regulator [Streptomyces mirabilis]|uniref:SbtR family transcriptional regulator n=1 Tax=Streptomyces mirabilis TaxID=68239 RepID=UPI003688C57D